MAKKSPSPFVYRGKWRAQVTLCNGMRPCLDFPKGEHHLAVQWIADQIANANSEHLPELGGPKAATLAGALRHYAGLYSITKRGFANELNRINHYLVDAGFNAVKAARIETGGWALEEYTAKALPEGFRKQVQARRTARTETYALIAELGTRRCSAISGVDMRRLVTTMTTEGLSPSTIQKELALLKHMFNMAAKEWNWRGFDNPCQGIKLGKSASRFVFLTAEQREALTSALERCDNPYFWPLVEFARESTLRLASLLSLQWKKVDLDGRVAQVPSKTGDVVIPLTLPAVAVLKGLVRDPGGQVFPMSSNAVKMAWNGVRENAGLTELQFRDIRHLGATDFARRGFTAHQLQRVLGHKSTRMAEIYVNLVQQDVLDAMDRTQSMSPVVKVPPPAAETTAQTLRLKRSERAKQAFLDTLERHRRETAAALGAGASGCAADTPPAGPEVVRVPACQAPPVTGVAASPMQEPPALPAPTPALITTAEASGAGTVIQVDFQRRRTA